MIVSNIYDFSFSTLKTQNYTIRQYICTFARYLIMSNISDYVQSAFKNLNEWLPSPTHLEAVSDSITLSIPKSLSNVYEYAIAIIFEQQFLIAATPEWSTNQRPTVIEHHHEALRTETGLHIIMLFGSMPSYIFQRCTKKKIDIMVGEKRIFLPSLFFLAESVNLSKAKTPKRIPALAQLMILYQLQRERIDGLTTRDLAQKLHTSYATVNRALNWLKENDIVTLNGEKEKTVSFTVNGKQLWEAALPFLDTPVEKSVRTNSISWIPGALTSGPGALGINVDDVAPTNCVALSATSYSNLKQNIVDDGIFGETEIEVWRYEPRMLSDIGSVDILSLYLSLRNSDSVAVKEELNALMETLAW